MHVLGITDYLGNVGGAEISTETILEGIAAHQAIENVTVVGIDTSTASRLDFDGVNIVPVTPPLGVQTLPEFVADLIIERQLAKAVRPYVPDVDIVHAHHRRSTLALRHINTTCPTVGTVRDFWPICPISIYHVDSEQCTGCDDRLDDCLAYQEWDGVTAPAIRHYLLAKRAHNRRAFGLDHAIFIADHLRKQVADSIRTPPSSVIYNPVSIDRDPVLDRPDHPTFVVASTLSKEKGVLTAVNAMEQICEHFSDARMVIFGDGPLESTLQERTKDFPEGTIDLRGRVPPDDVYDAMAAATATVFPSEWDEPFGRVTVESMALGTPVVGSRVGGIAEVIEDSVTGFLFEPGNADDLADQLLKLVGDQSTWNRISESGIECAEQFSVKRIVDEHVNLYYDIIQA